MLVSRPPIISKSKSVLNTPTLWIHPPHDNALSADVECLKWQAYLALRGLTVPFRDDIAPDGAIDRSLPNLHVPPDPTDPTAPEILAAHSIPAWADQKLGVDPTTDPLEGYKDKDALLESRAWITLLEGVVHAALLIAQPKPSYLHSLIFPSSTPPVTESLQKILSPPPAPFTGLWSLVPPTTAGVRVNTSSILLQYKEAISALSQCLGTDKWFLGSAEPTPLDALAFAYLHRILHSSDLVRIEVTRRVNLVAWEWRVRSLVSEKISRA